MKTLLLLRHAKAEREADAGDHARELAKKGRRAAERVGKLLADENLVPDRALSSTAARAKETAERALEHAGYRGSIDFFDQLYASTTEAYREVLRAHGGDAERLLVVGHNPTLEELVTELCGERVELPTAGLAECALPIASWSELERGAHAKLRMVWRVKELDE